MTVPEDTSKRDPLLHLAGAWDDLSTYVTDMEAAGQQQVVASSVLPIVKGEQRAKFEALGFVFGEQVDDLFQQAALPAGWSKHGSDHAMWSFVSDERGIDRVGVFYKAAFYDRRADMHLIRPGDDAVKKALYGDGAVTGPWSKLTAEELADAREVAENYLRDAEEYPAICERAPRAREVLEQIERVAS